MLKIKNLHASINGTPILNGVDLTINPGETHVIMGPNGSGKSTLANVLMGNPKFAVTEGEVLFADANILDSEPEARAAKGLFMAFQYPREIAGVQLDRFLFLAYSNIVKAQAEAQKNSHEKISSIRSYTVFDFNKKLEALAQELKMKPELVHRALNVGFSGGEKKKAEMLQMGLLPSKLAVLDETDSGLDVDALKVVGMAVNNYKNEATGLEKEKEHTTTPDPSSKEGKSLETPSDIKRSILIITHYNRILEYVKPDFVHVMVNGRIVQSGGKDMVGKLEKEGYEQFVTRMDTD